MIKDENRLNRRLDRFEQKLPRWLCRALRWLREPSSRWVRVPVGLLLMVGGVFGFLPILGLWMLPLGLVLLTQDIPFLRRPTLLAMVYLERRWIRWKQRRRRERATR